jgi:hypothetical protein
MEAIKLHKLMAMGKGYPKAKKISSDPSPKAAMPSADYKTTPKMKTEKVTGEGGGNGGTNSQRGTGKNMISTVMGGRK